MYEIITLNYTIIDNAEVQGANYEMADEERWSSLKVFFFCARHFAFKQTSGFNTEKLTIPRMVFEMPAVVHGF